MYNPQQTSNEEKRQKISRHPTRSVSLKIVIKDHPITIKQSNKERDTTRNNVCSRAQGSSPHRIMRCLYTYRIQP
jgi:hypothetical protein